MGWRGPHALSINYLTVAFDVVCDVVATLLPRMDRIEFLRGKGFACACPASCCEVCVFAFDCVINNITHMLPAANSIVCRLYRLRVGSASDS